MTAIAELKNNQSREQWDERRKSHSWMMSLGNWEHDFITILGAMSGKINPLNTIAGAPGEQWEFIFWGRCTNYSPEKRAKYPIAGSFKILNGTAPRMTVAKFLVAKFRGNVAWFRITWPAIKKSFKQSLLRLAIIWKPSIQLLSFYQGGNVAFESVDGNTETSRTLLLDEHTAALDPKLVRLKWPWWMSLWNKMPSKLLWSPTIWKMLEIWKSLDCHERRTHRPRPQPRKPKWPSQTTINRLRIRYSAP